MRWILQIVLLCFFIANVSAGITAVSTPVVLQYDANVNTKSSVYALKDSPLGTSTPQIQFQLSFQIASTPGLNTSIPFNAQVLLFHSSRFYEVGVREGLHSELCCTQKLFDQGSCNSFGNVVFVLSADPVRNGNTLYYNAPAILTNGSITSYTITVYPQNSGVWYVYIVNCDPQSRAFSFTGSISFQSPYGFIPSNTFFSIVVYFTVGGLFMVLLGFWLVWIFRYRVNLQFYQHGISILIILCLVEEIFWGWEYVNYNNAGLPTVSVLVPASILTALKTCWIRVLLLLMGLGFRIVTPFLSLSVTLGVIFITVFYFAVAVANAYLEVDSLFGIQIIPLAGSVNTGFLIGLNVIFIIWILMCTVGSMTTCKNEKQNLKYMMYQRNLSVFGTITATSVIFFFIQLGITYSYVADASWRSFFLLRTYWDCIYLLSAFFLCYIWRPATDNNRYAYGTQVMRDDTGMNMDQPPKSASSTKRGKKSKSKSRIAPPREVTLDDSSESSSD